MAARTSVRRLLKIFFYFLPLLPFGPGALASGPAALPGRAAPPAAPDGPIVLPRVSEEVDVDARLTEDVWSEAASVSIPWEVAPGDNVPAPVETVCRMAFDPGRLLVGCRARDPDPDAIRAFVTDRDAIGDHDRVVLALDPFNDSRRAFEFGVSALGVQRDALYDESTGEADDSWDTIWSSAGRETDRGYVVEMAIPFRSLRFPEGGEDRVWRFYLRRHRPRTEAVEMRSFRWDRGRACMLCQANRLAGISDVSPGTNIEVAPTLTASRTDTVGGDGQGLASGDVDPQPGVDLRWSPTPELALNVTVNPDFSQVEADAPQLDANRRFALFFPEKRPFFLEGADFFSTPMRAVFTRTVADPSVGMKLTGKLGANAVGLMVARDEVTNLLIPGNQGSRTVSLDQDVTAAFARFRRDVGSSGTVGGLYTGRVGSGYQNHVAGVDAVIRPLSPLTIRGQLLHSVTDDPAGVTGAAGPGGETGAYSGVGTTLSASYSTREWWADLSARAVSPQFRADAGFIPQVDVRTLQVGGGRTIWTPGDPFLTSIEFSGGGWHGTNWSGRLDSQALWSNFTVNGPWQSDLWIGPELFRRWFAGETHSFPRLWFGGSVRPSGAFRLGVRGFVGGAVDFTNEREVDQLRFSPSVRVRAGDHLDLRASFSWQQLTREGEEVVATSAAELRAVYNFSPRAFLRLTLQHDGTERNPDLHVEPVTPSRESVGSQLLFAYEVDPLTSLFVGYGDVREGSSGPDRTRNPLSLQRQSFFVKLGYGWRP